MKSIPFLTATRYHVPLRQGGSLPAVVETNDGALYVMKFAGAGQGPKALIAELISGEIARQIGLRVPEIAFIDLEAELAPSEPDPEIQDLLKASIGLNLGLRFLPRSFEYNPLQTVQPSPDSAAKIVWFDSYILNIDRTPRNVNMLNWQDDLWLIDHGASLYFHHNWPGYKPYMTTPFSPVKDHVLLPVAASLETIDGEMRTLLTETIIEAVIRQIPDEWLQGDPYFDSPDGFKEAYIEFLIKRRNSSEIFVQEAENAR